MNWPSSDRGMVRVLVIATILSWVLVAIVWSLFGATVVLVPIGVVAVLIAWVGTWMHRYGEPEDR